MSVASLPEAGLLAPEEGPLYRRLLAGLRDEISSGRLGPGDLIPPELEIARKHGISRHTVRAAILELAREGLLRRERGRGTFVVGREPLVRELGAFYSFAHQMREHGIAFRSRVLHRALRPATGTIAERLRLAEGGPVVELELLRLADTDGELEPVMLEFSLIPFERLPALLEADVTERSLYDVMADCHDVRLTLGREQLRPVVLDGRQAGLLEVSPGSPAFHVDRLAFAEGEPIEWRRSLVRGDRYLFRVELPVA